MEKGSKKSNNRFKFIPFSERISNINIDVFHRVPHRYEEESGEEYTYFHQAIRKWTVLNLTGKWKEFRKEIGYDTQTLPQLLNNKEKIVDVFLKNIRHQNELSHQPVLELMVAFVKDLRHELYPFYPQILKELFHLLKFKDPDVLESTFTCLAYIFKYLFREMVKDLDVVLLDLATLLNENNPTYVRDFAAQSFSFVARKVKDKNKLLSLVLYAIQTSPDISDGCGQLLFQMMKGLKGQTHSCAEELFLVLLNSLGQKSIPQKALVPLVSNIVTAYGNGILPQHSILFKVLIDVLKAKFEVNNHIGLKKLLNVVNLALYCKGGSHLQETHLSDMISILMKSLALELKVQKLASEICANMLILRNVKLPQEFASIIITKVMQVNEPTVVLQFVSQTSDSAGFEFSILPKAFRSLAGLNSIEFFHILTQIVVKKTSIMGIQNSNNFPKYSLTLQPSIMQIFHFANEILRNFIECGSDDLKSVLCTLILVRHFEEVEKLTIISLVVKVVNKLVKALESSEENKKKNLFTLCVALETLLHFKNEYSDIEDVVEINSFCETVLLTLKNDRSILALKSFDLFLSLHKDISLSDANFLEIYSTIQEWLLSSQSNSRWLALHSLQTLEESKFVKNNLMIKMLQDTLDAELVPLTINDYRNKLLLLDRLNFEGLGDLDEGNHKVLLKYLLGILYCNFQLLWDPLSRLISSYSVGMPINSFWEIFFSQLRMSIAYCKGMALLEDFDLPDFDDYLVESLKYIKAQDKVDHENYRNLLWTTMNLFPDICEAKNRDVISIYLPFIENEILKSTLKHNFTINMQKNELDLLDQSQENLNDGVEGESKTKTSYASTIKCAIAQLTVLSKFKNPKNCYREADVRNSYLNLLLYKDMEIQKKALECLFKYKFSYMIPYKQNLWNLIDDSKFKDELVHFQVDSDSGGVKDIHREELMPLVMRILYSKMLYQSSTSRGNKSSANMLRRSIILRFLSGISHSEMEMFLKMAFKKWDPYCEGDTFQFQEIIDSVDLKKVPLPKKLQNSINLADTVLNSFGGLMSHNLQRYIFKVVLCVGSYVCGLFAKRDDIFSGYFLSLKNLKHSCIEFVTKFFDRFQKFPWKEDDINAVFHIFIWPYLSKLPTEGIHGITGLLRLFTVWSENPRYFKLLVRYNNEEEKMNPLSIIMKLLLNEKAEHSVTVCIGNILERLLTLEDTMEVDEEGPVPLDIDYILPVEESEISKLKLKEELNYGSKILFPHVGVILTYLRRKLEKFELSAFGKGQMTILSRFSEMATSPEHGDALMNLLIKLLYTRKQMDEDDDVLINMISTVENLTNVVPNPSGYLRKLAVLFGIIELKQARKILINLVANMEKRCPELNQVATVVQNLNSWDSKLIDQPNFDKRLDTLKEIKVLVDEEKLNVDLAFIVLHNCFYFVRCEQDISLRESTSFYLKEISPKIALSLKNKGFLKQQWLESILNLVKKGIVSDNENVQTLSISLLGVMARECEDLHPVLKDLSLLANKLDPEVDFFENSQHLQIYRRLKALQKFSTIAKTLKKPFLCRTLIQFILPLASRYLVCSKYAGKNSLIDSAIEAVATVCRFLPWHQYQTILRFYLFKLRGKLEFQRQLTRIVIAILDSFHFCISSSPASELKSEEKKDLNKTTQEEAENKNSNLNKSSLSPDLQKFDKSEDKRESLEETVEKNVTEKEDVNKSVIKETNKVEKIKGGDKELVEELAEVLEESENAENVESECVEEDTQKSQDDKLAIEKVDILKPYAALRVEKAIGGSLLNQLYKIMAKKTQLESTHKINYKSLGSDRDEEDLIKVPIAVTVVKLLQKLPERILNSHLPGIFMTLCTYLKSRVESIRRVTRETLQQILFALGPKYLSLLFAEMSASLKKGFQVHVLVYTMHAVILHIHSLLKAGDIDENLPVILEACKSDLFGTLSEEKSVIKIQTKHREAKSTKSYHLINLVAQCLTEKCLTDLIMPVKEVLQNSYTHKNLVKCREYLRQVALGLSVNQFITFENLFIYIYGTTSESIPRLKPTIEEPPKKKTPKDKPDCFIIPPEPKNRMGALSNPVKRGSKSNAHIIVEFGLGLLHTLMKKEKLKNFEGDLRPYLDPMAPILINALDSQQVKVSTLAIQCLSKFIKYDLPSVKENVKKITDCLFITLHKYAAAGLSKGNNFDLVLATFKTVSVLIRETDYHGITAEQLKILLLYTDQDMHDNSRQATAFTLLRTILKKKLNSPELHELMKKVATLSITSDHSHVRQQARQNVFHYIMEYPLKKQIEYFIGFFTSQLNYETESGRQSSLEMIKNIIMHFPINKLEELSGVFLLTLGASLVNDNSSNCRKIISGLIKRMLLRLDKGHRDQLFEVLMLWFEQKKLSHRRLAAQVAGIFTSIEKEEFEKRLPTLLPIIQKQFIGSSTPGQFVRLHNENIDQDRMKDHHYFQLIQLVIKISSNVPDFLTSEKYQESVYFLTETAHSLLCHPHEWIRFASAQFLGHVFNSCDPNDVATVLNGQAVKSKQSFLESITIHRRIKSLILDHCNQFISGAEISQEFQEQIVKNLVYLARVLGEVKDTDETKKKKATDKIKDDEDDEDDEMNCNDIEEEKPNLSLLWMTKRMRRIINIEITQNPSSKALRTVVLKWIGAVTMCISRSAIKSVLYHLMAPVIRERELTDALQGENPFKALVTEVSGMLKKKVGVEIYSKEAIKINAKLMERRIERKNKRTQEFVTDPERAAKRKMERQKKKRELRKRKLESVKEKKGKIKKRRKNSYKGA